MVTREQSIAAVGDDRYTGWGETEMKADMTSKGLTAGNGSSSSSSGLPAFSFDQNAAEQEAIDELTPYYTKLLEMYNGDVSLAKKRMEQDYERGLRYNKQETTNATTDVNAAKAESARKFKIALGDLDQEMNGRGLFNSGIRTKERANTTDTQNYDQSVLDAKARDLALSSKKYEEEQGVTLDRWLEDYGFKDTGVEGFTDKVTQKKIDLTEQKMKEAADMANEKRNQAYQNYVAGTSAVATATPSNYAELLNAALKTSGITATT